MHHSFVYNKIYFFNYTVLSVLISTYSYININTIKTERWFSHLEKLSLCSSFVSVSPVNLPLGTTYLVFVLMVLLFADIT